VVLRERRGNEIWGLVVFPIRLGGEIRYAGGLAREITVWSAADQELRYTVLGALKAQEFERNMVSRFLHDTVGQNLTALGLQLDLIRMDLENAQPETCARVIEIQRILEAMMQRVREYSYELNPSTVERAGLRSALDRLTARIRGRFTGSLRVNVDPFLEDRDQDRHGHVPDRPGGRRERHPACQLLRHRNCDKVHTRGYCARDSR